jgi:hypothetical protein
MNLFYNLPHDIRTYIFNIVKTSYINSIIKAWKRYYSYKTFIFKYASNSPVCISLLDGEFTYDITHPFTHYYFKKFSNIFTGNESNYCSIYILFYTFATSINDYELTNDGNNNFYAFNKLYCTRIAHKFHWNAILHILD